MRRPIDRRPLHIGIVLLVGGQSKRMGCNKQLCLGIGKTVLDAVCGLFIVDGMIQWELH